MWTTKRRNKAAEEKTEVTGFKIAAEERLNY